MFLNIFEYFQTFLNVFERFFLAHFAQTPQADLLIPVFSSKIHILPQNNP